MRHWILGLAIALAFTADLAAQRRGIEGSFDRTLTVSGPLDLDVETGSGSISIRQGTVNRVEIHAKIRAGTDRRRSDRDAEDLVELNPLRG